MNERILIGNFFASPIAFQIASKLRIDVLEANGINQMEINAFLEQVDADKMGLGINSKR